MFESNAVSHSSLFADLFQLGRALFLRRSAPGSFSPDIGKLPGIMLLYGLFAIFLSIALNGKAGGALELDGAIFIPFGVMALIAGLVRWVDGRLNGGAIWIAFSLLLLMLPLAGFIGAKLYPLLKTLDFSGLHALPFWPAWLVGKLPDFIATLPHVWLALTGTVLVARGKPYSGWRRSLCVPLTTLALLAVFTSINPLAIWQVGVIAPSPTDDAAAETDGLTVDEDIFYGQPRILAERLATIKPGKPGVPEIFFLGLAGSEEDVFMRETIAVEQRFRDRYQTSGHSMILVNNPAMARTLPFASLKSLTMALQRIGERMNGKEDLLFLFLTSHGKPDSLFSISLWPFEFTDIDPQSLRKALNDAEIERRIVVISACYSGNFVPALADENTLVMTAAAA
ncbi:MAG: C13 family peptidase, partial [Azoarcus sp.]|nr:C13 family peptidase [Azoarcus sp.]